MVSDISINVNLSKARQEMNDTRNFTITHSHLYTPSYWCDHTLTLLSVSRKSIHTRTAVTSNNVCACSVVMATVSAFFTLVDICEEFEEIKNFFKKLIFLASNYSYDFCKVRALYKISQKTNLHINDTSVYCQWCSITTWFSHCTRKTSLTTMNIPCHWSCHKKMKILFTSLPSRNVCHLLHSNHNDSDTGMIHACCYISLSPERHSYVV